MRILAIVLLASISSMAFADETPQVEPVSYYIAPGVLVTSFYTNADKAAESTKTVTQTAPSAPPHSSYVVAPSTMSMDYPSYWNQPTSATPTLIPARYYDTSNRFHMQQGGKTMTADDFDRWIEERGLRISGGRVVRVK